MLKQIGTKGLAAALGLLGFGIMGCEVDTVVYEPHPRREVVVEEEPPPPPAGEVVVQGPGYAVEGDVVVDAPPEVRYEDPGPPPAVGFVWVGGFWDRRDGHYVWVRGHWDRPPAGRRHWTVAHWEHRGNGYVRIEGHWD